MHSRDANNSEGMPNSYGDVSSIRFREVSPALETTAGRQHSADTTRLIGSSSSARINHPQASP